MKKLQTLLLLVLAGLIIAALTAWQANKLNLSFLTSHAGLENSGRSATNDSFPNRVIAEGRVVAHHGEHLTLSAEIGGRIEKLTVNENTVVSKGDLIAEINVDDLRAAVVEAKVRIAEIDTEIRLADIDLGRHRKLIESELISQQEVDRAQRNFDLASAQRATAEATVKRLEATVAKSRVHSPINGVVLTRYAQPGEVADVGTKLVSIANTKRVRIEAELDEFDVGHVSLGQSVKITAEGFPGKSWQGVVEEIPDAVSEKNLKPLDPARPSDARVLRLKIAFKETTPLKLGQRVEVEIFSPLVPRHNKRGVR